MAKKKLDEPVAGVEVEVLEELSPDEERERHRLELRVERSLFEAGSALGKLRDKRLYRSTHNSFEAYVQQRFGYSRVSAHYKIAAAEVFENLLTNGEQILPTSERQVRDIINHPPELQCSIWSQGVEQAGGKVPTGRLIKGIAERLKEKTLQTASYFCSVGDVFLLTKLEGAERKYNGCWAIASDTEGITVNVDVHDGSLRVSQKNLKRIDSPEIHRQLPAILERIRRLRNCGMLDRCAYTVLESLGRQTYLTDFEADLLRFMEQRYGINEQSSADNS